MTADPTFARRTLRSVVLPLSVALPLAACSGETEPQVVEARPVRTVTVERREAGTPITLTGRIEAEDEVALGFRISGRMIENDLKLGDRVAGRTGGRAARVAERAERAARRARRTSPPRRAS